MLDGQPTDQEHKSSTSLDAALSPARDATEDIIKPEIPHITDRFIPIAHVIAVVIRSAYHDLRKLRQNLIEAPDQKRKKRLVDHAVKYRAEITKVLVLVAWAARASEVSTAIDLRAWLQGQKNCFDNVYSLLRFDVLRNLESAKITGPDVPTAIDVLTTGTLPPLKQSSLAKQFQTPTPLRPLEIVRTLRTLDSLLSLRLVLHEKIPCIMRDYTISSGRVTFRVNNEFHMDLFFASEQVDDPNLQWFMIDFQFAFTEKDYIDTPLSLKLEVENIANGLLGRLVADGAGHLQLAGLYNFLHSFTIQYKLERLFSQFSVIGGRDKGRIDVKYASAQKILAVGFWLQKRHREKKSVLNSMTVTIESPETTLKAKLMSSSSSTTAEYNREQLRLVVRLGEQEQSYGRINIEEHGASSLLSAVVKNRISSVLHQLLLCLEHKDLPYTNSSSMTTPHGLKIKLYRDEQLHLSMDEYNGNYLVSILADHGASERNRPNKAIEQLQATLNSLESAGDVAARLHEFKFKYLKKAVELSATSASWTVAKFTPTSVHLDEFGRAFSVDDLLVSPTTCLFLTRVQEGWKDTEGGSSWFVVVSMHTNLVYFWLAEFVVNEKQAKMQISWVERLRPCVEQDSLSVDAKLDPTTFDKLWRLCTARIISLQLSRGLGDRSIDHRYLRNSSVPSWASIDIPTIVFATEDITDSKVPWAAPLVRVELLQLCTDVAGGAMVSFLCQRVPTLDFDFQQCGDIEIHADPLSSQFSFNFRAVVAQNSNVLVDQFYRKWRMVENTIGMLDAVKNLEHPFLLQNLRLNSASFAYHDNNYLIHLQQQPSLLDDSIQFLVTLGSTTSRRNPHERISQFLPSIVSRFQSNLRVFFELLNLTLPVLEALHVIEQESFSNPKFYIVARSAETFRIYYPQISVTLLIRARPAPKAEALPEQFKGIANSIVWHFTDGSRSTSPVMGQNRIDSCDKIFAEGFNETLDVDETFPEGSGIGSTPALATRVLLELHKTILEHQLPPNASRPRTSTKPKTKKGENMSSTKGQSKKTEKSNSGKGRSAPNDTAKTKNDIIEIT